MPLTPLNECGVAKFVCTTLRPSLPACTELYSLESCARFVSEFLTYEPLANALHPPTHLPSPTSVLAWQSADAFDASGVLASLLLGAGFNAYVVMGYAPQAVTLNNQSGVECPLLSEQAQAQQQLLLQATTASVARPGSAAAAAAAGSSAGSPGTKAVQQQQPVSGIGSGSAAGTSSSLSPPAGLGSTSSSSGAGCVPAAGSMAGRASGTKASTSGSGSTAAAGPGSSSGSGSGSAAAAADEPGKRKKYQIPPTPQLLSRFLQQHPQQEQGSEDGSSKQGADLEEAAAGSSAADVSLNERGSADGQLPPARASQGDSEAAAEVAQQQQQDKLAARRVHAWVLVLPGRREVRLCGLRRESLAVACGGPAVCTRV
jgi:hypothetical protein